MKNIYIESYGCFANQDNEAIMKGILVKEGFKIINKESKADIIIINTCVVKGSTVSKMISRIRHFKDKNLIISGCMPESEAKLCKKLAPDASLINTFHVTDTIKAVKSLLNKKPIDLLGKRKEILLNLPKIEDKRAIIQISQGCTSYCLFCETKLAKGVLISFPKEKIIQEIKNKIKSGNKTINLTATDTGCYGFDIKTNLPELLNEIVKIKSSFKIKIGMMNPEHVIKLLPKILEAYDNEHVFKFFHLTVQSGSNEILKKMKRRHTTEDFLSTVKEIRSTFPLSTIWTDMICGFPEETEEDFSLSLNLLKQAEPDFSNVSAYGNRPGTLAAKMKQVDTVIKKERTRKMSDFVRTMSEHHNKKWIGWSGKIIIDEFNEAKQTWMGRNFAYKSVVVKGDYILGETINVKITDAAVSNLIA